VLQESPVATYSLHARIDNDLKDRIVDYVDANRKVCPTITAFVLAAVEEKLERAEVDERTRTGQILLDLLRSDEAFREAVKSELREL
jgi:hypothetical protein